MGEIKLYLSVRGQPVSNAFKWGSGHISYFIFNSLDFYKFADCVGARTKEVAMECFEAYIRNGTKIIINGNELSFQIGEVKFVGRIIHHEHPYGVVFAIVMAF